MKLLPAHDARTLGEAHLKALAPEAQITPPPSHPPLAHPPPFCLPVPEDPPAGSAPAYTNDLGVVSFPNLYIDKAGGYTITAKSEVGGSASAFFNISGR